MSIGDLVAGFLRFMLGRRTMKRICAAGLVCLIIYFLAKETLTQEIKKPASPWAWSCVGEGDTAKCVKVRAKPNSIQQSLETCSMTCSPYGSLFPRPKHVRMGKTVVNFLPNRISQGLADCNRKICSLLSKAVSIFKETVNKYHPDSNEGVVYWRGPWSSVTEKNELYIEFDVPGLSEYLNLKVDESYTLNVTTLGSKVTVNIKAPTFFGARHALETLSQMIAYDHEENALQMVASAMIVDSPDFPYRGVLLDTARSFIPVKDIKRTIDGMSYSKLNTFHWHITDAQSFPLLLNSVREMAEYGASHPKKMYTPQDIRDIVEYARLRGIRVLPELDGPAHMGHGWQWGEEHGLGKLVVCLDKQPWVSYCAGPPCGQINLGNENIYAILEKILKEMAELFAPIDLFHYGGDEIFMNCWNSSTEVTDWMELTGQGRTKEAFFHAWSVYQERVRNLFNKGNNGVSVPGIVWTSTLTAKENVDKYLGKDKYIIQIWTKRDDKVVGELLKKGYQVIFSNYDVMYLDCGVASWVGAGNNWCSPYKGWQGIYDNDIVTASNAIAGEENYNRSQLLGAEVTLWTEQADQYTLDSRLWPRASAHAERMWTNPAEDYSKAERRILEHRERFVARGLKPERLQPEWCRQNAGDCRDSRIDNPEIVPESH